MMGYSANGVGIVKIVVCVKVEVIVVATEPDRSTSLSTIKIHYPFSAKPKVKQRFHLGTNEIVFSFCASSRSCIL